MPDFDKLSFHVDALNKLLSDREPGLYSWCVAVGNHWRIIAELWSIEEGKKEH